MTKRLMCILLTLLMGVQMSVSAAFLEKAEFTTDLKIKISGKVENGGNEKVSVMILPAGTVLSDSATPSDVDYYREITASADGSFNLSVLFDDKAKGYRDIKIAALGSAELYEDVVYVVKESDITDFIGYMNSSSVTSDGILENLPIINEEASEYNSLPAMRNKVASLIPEAREVMFNNEFELISDVKEAFNMALLVAKINASSSKSQIESAINSYAASSTLSAKCYMSYFNAYKSQALAALEAGKPLSVQTLDEILGETLILSAVKNVLNHNSVTQIITDNNSFLKLDLTKYNKLTDKSSVNKAVMKKTNSLSEFKSSFVSLTDAAYISQNSNSSSPSSPSRPSSTVVGNVTFDSGAQGANDVKEYFNDLIDFSWAKESINSLASLGIVNGVGEGKFDPARYVTREEFVKMIVGAFAGINKNAKVSFKDINENDWCYPFIATAFEKSYVNGVTVNTFGKGQNIKRQDAAVILARILGKKAAMPSGFADSEDISEYALEAVNLMKQNNIINGNEQNKFLPQHPLSRAECAKMIYALYKNIGEVK